VRRVAPRPGDTSVVKPRYSGFDHTPLELVLESLAADAVVIAGAATEMCVRDTAIDAVRRDLDTTVVREACVTVDLALEELALDALARLSGVQVVARLGDRWGAPRG
jgi:nicotinamidase-related amidase